MVLCDWEMSFVGPRGKDAGWFQSFPIAAALSHAAHGHREEMAANVFEHVVAFWEEYEKVLRASGRDEDLIRETYLSTLGWTGFMMLAYNMMGIHMNYIPTDDIPEATKDKVIGSIGYIGFKLSELSFVKIDSSPAANMSLADLKKFIGISSRAKSMSCQWLERARRFVLIGLPCCELRVVVYRMPPCTKLPRFALQ